MYPSAVKSLFDGLEGWHTVIQDPNEANFISPGQVRVYGFVTLTRPSGWRKDNKPYEARCGFIAIEFNDRSTGRIWCESLSENLKTASLYKANSLSAPYLEVVDRAAPDIPLPLKMEKFYGSFWKLFETLTEQRYFAFSGAQMSEPYKKRLLLPGDTNPLSFFEHMIQVRADQIWDHAVMKYEGAQEFGIEQHPKGPSFVNYGQVDVLRADGPG